MKNLILSGLLMLAMVPVAMAKDGPFPISASQGTWTAYSVDGSRGSFVVEIKAGKPWPSRPDVVTAQLSYRTSARSQSFAGGRAMHYLLSRKLVVPVTTVDGLDQSRMTLVPIWDDETHFRLAGTEEVVENGRIISINRYVLYRLYR